VGGGVDGSRPALIVDSIYLLSLGMPIKAEKVLAELNRLRSDLHKDPQDIEWFTLHHAFCFISYKMGEFQKYLNETVKEGEYPED
jgi:hypothetical protein